MLLNEAIKQHNIYFELYHLSHVYRTGGHKWSWCRRSCNGGREWEEYVMVAVAADDATSADVKTIMIVKEITVEVEAAPVGGWMTTCEIYQTLQHRL